MVDSWGTQVELDSHAINMHVQCKKCHTKMWAQNRRIASGIKLLFHQCYSAMFNDVQPSTWTYMVLFTFMIQMFCSYPQLGSYKKVRLFSDHDYPETFANFLSTCCLWNGVCYLCFQNGSYSLCWWPFHTLILSKPSMVFSHFNMGATRR